MIRSDIVVGVDASEGSAAALAWALDDAARRSARVRAVLAWADDGRPAAVDAVAASPRLEDLAAAARDVLHHAVAAARPGAGRGPRLRSPRAGVHIDELAVYGTPTHALLQESLSAGLLVLGAWPRAATRWALPGPVGDACAHEAPIPLVVVPGDLGPAWERRRHGRPVVVGVDGSPASAAAAHWAADEAALRGVPLHVVEVEPLPGTEIAGARAAPPVPALVGAQASAVPVGSPARRTGPAGAGFPARERPHDAVGRVVSEIQAIPGAPPVRRVPLHGPAATRLLEAAQEAQLLVLGARGAGGFPALSLGSTAHRCLAQAPCPTAIIRGRGY
jgi:nucleotide-binding universal stress UspA family protein